MQHVARQPARDWDPVAAFLFTLLTGCLILCADHGAARAVTLRHPERIEISVTPLAHFEKARPERIVDPDGRKAVSDTGPWLTADITSSAGRLRGVTNARVGPLLGPGGRLLKRHSDKDAEGVTLADGSFGNGTVLVSFERNHRIGRLPFGERGLGAPTSFLTMPADARRLTPNESFELVAVLQGGRLKGATIAFLERFVDPRGHHTGWVWIGGAPRKLYMVNRAGFEITDAASGD